MLRNERIDRMTFTRRDALKIAGAAGVMAALPWSGIEEAEAAPPTLKGPQAGGYYRFAIGEIEAIVISDGGLSFQPIQPTWAPEASKEELEGTLRSSFLPTDRLNLDVNTLLLKIGGELILVDSGAGRLFGPSLGKQSGTSFRCRRRTGAGDGRRADPRPRRPFRGAAGRRREAGLPERHVFRLEDRDRFLDGVRPRRFRSFGSRRRGRRRCWPPREEVHRGDQRALTPVAPGKKIVEGLEVVDAPGHTPGHIALLVSSGKEAAASRRRHGPPRPDVRPPRVDLLLRRRPEDGGGDEAQDPRPGGGRRDACPGVPPRRSPGSATCGRQREAPSSGCRSRGTGRREGILRRPTGGRSPAAGSPPCRSMHPPCCVTA